MKRDRSLEIDAFLKRIPDVKRTTKSKPRGLNEKLYETFLEIVTFYEENNSEPSLEADGLAERSLAVKLHSIRTKHNNNEQLKSMDTYQLLTPTIKDVGEGDKRNEAGASSERECNAPIIPEDDLELEASGNIEDFLARIGSEADDDPNSIFNLRHVTPSADKIENPEYRAKRKPCSDFYKFEQMFESTLARLEEKSLNAIPFQKESAIEKGEFFILKGSLIYIAEVEDEYEKNNKINARMRVIYDNGTESYSLRRSIARELYRKKNGRRITSKSTVSPSATFSADPESDDIATGKIYVLATESEHDRVKPIRNIIHKIGFTTTTVAQRISSAETKPTYLMAGVRVVAEYNVYNVKVSKIEDLLHKYFDAARADITIKDRFGKLVHSTEWFFVLPHHVREAVERLADGTLGSTYFDPRTATIKNFW